MLQRNDIADFHHGRVVLPPVLEAYFNATWIGCPQDDDNRLAACRLAFWLGGANRDCSGVEIELTRSLKNWLMTSARDWETTEASLGIPIPKLLLAALPGYNHPWGIDTPEGRLAHWWWFITLHGHDFELPDWALTLLSSSSERKPGASLLMEAILENRSDLTQSWDDPNQRTACIGTMLRLIRNSLKDYDVPEWQHELLSHPSEAAPPEFPYPYLVEATFRSFGMVPPKSTEDATLLPALGTFFVSMLPELPHFELPEYFLAPLLDTSQGESLLLRSLHAISPVAAENDINSPSFVGWLVNDIMPELPFRLPMTITDQWKRPAQGLEKQGVSIFAKSLEAYPEAPAIPKHILQPGPLYVASQALQSPIDNSRQLGGVNIIGWVNGILGVGEDVRCGLQALDVAEVPNVLLDATETIPHHGANEQVIEKTRIKSSPKYCASIVQLAAQDFFRFHLAMPESFWADRIFFGCFPWELPRWPRSQSAMVEPVDEIWAPSRFVAQAFEESGRPVRLMPLAVSLEHDGSDMREELGYTDEDFLVLHTFDAKSWLRKNPEAVVEVFKRTFPDEPNAKLLLKLTNGHCAAAALNNLKKICNDSRISIMDHQLERAKINSLTASCNVFISLHHSEGFGRNLAEAMLLERPIICSNWSGNTDFTTPETAWLVDGNLVDVPKEATLSGTRQQWFNANINQASNHLRALFEGDSQLKKRTKKGKTLIKTQHGPKSVGKRMRTALTEWGVLPVPPNL